MEKTKFPRTPHLPFSGSINSDDLRLKDLSQFYGKDIIITEKMDGENISIYKDSWHARSLDSKHKDYHSYLQNKIVPIIQSKISNNTRVVGEYLYRRHTIPYDNLEGYLEIICIVQKDTEGKLVVLEWDDTDFISLMLGVPIVYELMRIENFSRDKEKELLDYTRAFAEYHKGEGFVIRNAASFPLDDWSKNVAKYVRKGYQPGFGEGYNKLKETKCSQQF